MNPEILFSSSATVASSPESIYKGSTRTGGIGMPHTGEWPPGYVMVSIDRVWAGWDQHGCLCAMDELATDAMDTAMAALILARLTRPIWPHSVTDCLKSTPAVTSAPAVQRPAPARGSCWRCTPAARLE